MPPFPFSITISTYPKNKKKRIVSKNCFGFFFGILFRNFKHFDINSQE